MKIENYGVYNMINAMRGMRNPKNSWIKNDTTVKCDPNDGKILEAIIGPNDTKLAQTLIKCGSEHRKFLRQIFVSADFTMPNYLSNEFDTYKLGTTRNSCSLQHKGASKEFTFDDFSIDDNSDMGFWDHLLFEINKLRDEFNSTGDYNTFRKMRQLLPQSYNYKFTWTGSYENLLNMYNQRKCHKLREWHEICDWIKTLPGMNVFLIENEKVVK